MRTSIARRATSETQRIGTGAPGSPSLVGSLDEEWTAIASALLASDAV